MAATQTAEITYRKTKTGEWVAYGPASIVRPGAVTVAKRDGTSKTETVTRTGRTFTVGAVEMVYGYLAKSAPAATTSRQSSRRYDSPGRCLDCGGRLTSADRHASIPGYHFDCA